jgi:hypothetical protein
VRDPENASLLEPRQSIGDRAPASLNHKMRAIALRSRGVNISIPAQLNLGVFYTNGQGGLAEGPAVFEVARRLSSQSSSRAHRIPLT